MPQFSNENNNGNPFRDSVDCTNRFSREDIEANKVICGLSYLGAGFLFFLPLVVCPNSAFGKFHSNQALILLILNCVLAATSMMFRWIPLIGWMIRLGIGLLILVFMILCMIYTFQGNAKQLPIIGRITIIR